MISNINSNSLKIADRSLIDIYLSISSNQFKMILTLLHYVLCMMYLYGDVNQDVWIGCSGFALTTL